MDATRHAVFRADASVAMGGGHVRRCLVLADALAEAGWTISFVCNADAVTIVPALSHRGFAVIEAQAFDAAVPPPSWRGALLVVDHYQLDAAFESACRPWAARILVVDDLADRRHDCDVLLDQSPGRCNNDYAALVPADCQLLLGPSYALLDRRFRVARRTRKPAGKVRRIVVNFGTTDTANATAVALDALDQAKTGVAIDVVIGSAAPHLPSLRARLPADALHVDVDDMAALLQRADLAIGAGGVGALERCALGVPSLILTVADNQVTNATALVQAGAALYLGTIADNPSGSIAAAVRNLCADDVGRHAMSAAAAALVDGLGARMSGHPATRRCW